MPRNSRGSARSGLGLLEVTDAGLPRRIKGAPTPRSRRAGTISEDSPGSPDENLDEETTGDPLYPVALLKLAMAMRRLAPEEELHFEAILEEVLTDLSLDGQAFRGYLDRNLGRLMTAVRARGY